MSHKEVPKTLPDERGLQATDNNGRKYNIPEGMKAEFDRLLEVGKKESNYIQFIETFSKYQMKKEKHPKMDRLLISHEPYELSYAAKKAGVHVDDVRKAIEAVGHSRRKVYAYLKLKKDDKLL